MPLATPSQLISSRMLDTIGHLQGLYQVATMHLNRIVSDILSADDAALAAFANHLGPVELSALCQAHLDQGTAINAAVVQLNAIAMASGLPAAPASVDIRPLTDKLAAQYRALEYVDGAFVVTRLPQPEPATEPPAEP